MPGCALQYCATAERTSSFAAASARARSLFEIALIALPPRYLPTRFSIRMVSSSGWLNAARLLAQRVVDRREHDPVLLGHVDAAGGHRLRLELQRREQLLDLLPFPNLHAERRRLVERPQRMQRRRFQRLADLRERHRELRFVLRG